MTAQSVTRGQLKLSWNIPLEFVRREWLAIALTLASLVPVWLVHFLPTQDGPSHLYNAQVLREFANPAFHFQEYYRLSFALFPNWIAHTLLALLMIVFHPLIAEKLLISLYVILSPICTFYFIGAVNQRKHWLGLLCFPLIYNYLLLMGFYGFAFAVPLFALALGYWWKSKDQMTWRKALVMNLLLVALFFCHLVPYATAVFVDALRDGLRELGYVEGKNIVIEYRYAEGKTDRFTDLAVEMVRLNPDVIVVGSTSFTAAAKQATNKIPIIANGGDLVGQGLVASLARPGGNVTGSTNISPDLAGKRLELLEETVAKAPRVAVLWHGRGPDEDDLKQTEIAARAFGVKIQALEVRDPRDFQAAFAATNLSTCDVSRLA